MEAELTIKLPDGTTKTIQLKDVTYSTTYGTDIQPVGQTIVVARLNLSAVLVDATPAGV